MLGKAIQEVERIWRGFWSHELEKLGLISAVKKACAEFAERTGVSIQVECDPGVGRLPAETELALYRILQNALLNVEQHAQARLVTVRLARLDPSVQLTIQDDGIGFEPDTNLTQRDGKPGFGMIRMRESAASMGGVMTVKSTPRGGTEVEVRIPWTAAETE